MRLIVRRLIVCRCYLIRMENLNQEYTLQALGSKVRSKRTDLKLSQEQLADICEFDRTYISLIERGKRNISYLNLEKLARGLETTISELTKEI